MGYARVKGWRFPVGLCGEADKLELLYFFREVHRIALNHGAFVVLFLNPDPVLPGYFLTVQNPKFGFLITQGFKVLCRFLLCVEL